MLTIFLAFLALAAINAAMYAGLAFIWTAFANNDFIGDWLLRPEYRIDRAIMEALAADLVAKINFTLGIAIGMVILAGAVWLSGIWAAHMDGPGQIPRLRQRWTTTLILGMLITVVVLWYQLFMRMIELPTPANMFLLFLFVLIYLKLFIISTFITTPHIAGPAIPLWTSMHKTG